MKPLRITEVVTTDVFAGTERYVADVARELGRRGHDVVVVGGDPAPMIRTTGPDVRWLPGASTRAAVRTHGGGGGRANRPPPKTQTPNLAPAPAPPPSCAGAVATSSTAT